MFERPFKIFESKFLLKIILKNINIFKVDIRIFNVYNLKYRIIFSRILIIKTNYYQRFQFI